MTYEEALETINADQVKKMLEMVKAEEKYHFLIPLFEKQIEFYQIASEAISLQIAKKPTNMESVPYSNDDDWITYGICPNCKQAVNIEADKDRCFVCGQVLDWSEGMTYEGAMKIEAAKEIFFEIENHLARYSHIHQYAEDAKKTTEEYADGNPCEMTSVWEVLSLHENGWDDYETMCKLQDNIQEIAKSRLLKEIEGDIAALKKKYIGG